MYKQYEEYKDSGTEWIGEIPNTWKTIKFKYCFSIIGGNGFPEILQGKQFGEIPFCKCSDINDKNIFVTKANNYISYEECKKYQFNIIPKNSILIAKIGEALKKNHRKINKIECCIDNNMEAFTLKMELTNIFYYYILKCIDMLWFDNGGTIPSVNNEKLKNFKLPYLIITEQQQIADYLDKKCGEIDNIVEKQKNIIEELKEYKQAVITEAVTKGLDKSVQLKDSGIEWIGQIPEHWEIEKVKNIFFFGKGLSITKDDLTEEGIAVISYGQIHSKTNNGTSINDDLIRYVPEIYLTNKQSLVNKGDFIFADTSEDLEGAGNCVFIDREMQLFAGYHSIILKLKQKEYKFSKYLSYLFRTNLWRVQVRSEVSGIKVYSISQKILKNITVLVPSKIEELITITEYLDKKCSKIDTAISEKKQLIKKLTEYKKSLIYECVTGKRKIA